MKMQLFIPSFLFSSVVGALWQFSKRWKEQKKYPGKYPLSKFSKISAYFCLGFLNCLLRGQLRKQKMELFKTRRYFEMNMSIYLLFSQSRSENWEIGKVSSIQPKSVCNIRSEGEKLPFSVGSSVCSKGM